MQSNPALKRAWGQFPATHGVAVLTIAISLGAMVWPGLGVAASEGGFVPAALDSASGITQAVPAWLTPLSSAFLHSGFLHLAFNLIMLVYCGRQVEAALGSRLWLLLYGLGIYAAAAAQWMADPAGTIPMIGASGAISAIVGAYAAMFNQQQVSAVGPLSSYWVRILWLAAAWIGLQLLIGLASGGDMGGSSIAIWAHIGGFVIGLLLARPLLKHRYRAR